MQNFIFILSPFIFATACLAASEGVEYFKNLSLDCVRITGVEKIEAGNKIDGAKAATVNVNGQKYTEEAELFVPEEDEEE